MIETAPPSNKQLFNSRVVAWSLWDWGSAAFNAVATTFVFSVYLTTDGLFTDKDTASQILSIGLTIAGFIIAVFAPITGQRADRQGKGTLLLGVFTGLVIAAMLGMYFVWPGSMLGSIGALWLGVAMLGLGNIFFEFASVNYNAMLSRIATPENTGRVSGFGWGMGYVGGIGLLLILYIGFISPEVGWFGVSGENNMNIRISMVLSALWYLVFALPVLLKIRGREVPGSEAAARESLATSYRLLWETVKTIARESPQTLKFLIASAIFRDGLAGVFTYGAILAAGTFGFSSGDVMVFAIIANLVAGVATIGFGVLDDRFGPKAVMMFSLAAMVVLALVVFFGHSGGKTVFWIFGMTLCVFVGPTQSAARSFLSRMIPSGREGEIFGLYATTGRAVSFLSPLMFLVMVTIGKLFVPVGVSAQYWGILGIALILLAGFLLMLRVKGPERRP